MAARSRLITGTTLLTVYGHLSAMAVVAGQHVTRGQIIGYVGQSGRSTGPHLHYEVRVHLVPVNPHKYLRTSYTQLAAADSNSLASGGQINTIDLEFATAPRGGSRFSCAAPCKAG